MVTANELTSVDTTRVQAPQLQPRGESTTQRNSPPPATEDVRVSISAEARAAQETTRIAAPTQGPDDTTPPDETASANPVQAARRNDSLRATDNATASPTTTAQDALAERANAAGTPEQEPDAASAAGRSATQLYLENAARPDNQTPAPSSLRTSA